ETGINNIIDNEIEKIYNPINNKKNEIKKMDSEADTIINTARSNRKEAELKLGDIKSLVEKASNLKKEAKEPHVTSSATYAKLQDVKTISNEIKNGKKNIKTLTDEKELKKILDNET